MDEYTQVTWVSRLPYGQRWSWHPDANVIAIAREKVTEAEKSLVLHEVYCHWRKNCVAFDEYPEVPAEDDFPNVVSGNVVSIA